VTYDQYNTIWKTCVIFNIIWNLINKSNCYMNFIEMTLSKYWISITNPLGSHIQ
jgi:hypothetical protein